ncbi:hypothetical protein AgCh_031177 [Apium graveolens]
MVIDKSFGFDSAVEEPQRAINAAHVEAESTENEPIEHALKRQQCGLDPDSDNLSIIIESLSLTADLKESIALEKERMRVVTNKSQGDIDLTNQLVRGRAVTRFYRNG